MESTKGREIHALAEHAREGGKFEDALKHLAEARYAYIMDGDLLGASESLSSEVFTYLHLAEQTGKTEFKLLAEISAMQAIKMAEMSNQPEALAIPYHTLGKVQEDLGEWSEAVDAHQKAIEVMQKNPPERHNRPAYLAEINSHLYQDRYMAGNKDALSGIDQAIEVLEKNEGNEPKYNRDVWLSGAYMRKARVLRTDNPEVAKEAMLKAKAVIDANPDLGLRLKQWEKVANEFGL